MKAKWVGSSLLVLALTASFAARPASGASAPEPQAATGCRSISVDLTDPAVVALLRNGKGTRPIGEVRVEEKGEGAGRTRSATQDFEVITENSVATPITVTCKSGPCSGFSCAVVGCNPITIGGEAACSPCNCVPIEPAIICTPNTCTCEKTSTRTSEAAAPTGLDQPAER